MAKKMPQKKKKKHIKSKKVNESRAMEEECFDDFNGGDGINNHRRVQKTQFQELDSTKEYCETHYYKVTNGNAYVEDNQFWASLASHLVGGGDLPFVTEDFLSAVNSTTELVAVLALLDLPYLSPNHKFETTSGRGINIHANSNLVLFKKEIKEAEADLDTILLVIHRFFELDNKNSEKKIKEFLTNQIYGCEVIITNVSQRS